MVEKKNNMEYFNEHESHESHEFNKRRTEREGKTFVRFVRFVVEKRKRRIKWDEKIGYAELKIRGRKKNNMEFFNEHESHESHEFNKREGLREEERKLATPS